jgi:hypothetical protein
MWELSVSEESYSHLTDDQIVEGSYDRQMGEAILQMWKEGRKRQEEETLSLLDAIGQAHQEEPGG